MLEKIKQYQHHFSENKFWNKLRQHARKVGLKTVYTALLLFYAYRRRETPTWARSIIIGLLGYFLAPIDLIPDLSPVLGYTDDLGVLAFGLVAIAGFINDDVKTKARTRLEGWFGNYDETELKEIDAKL